MPRHSDGQAEADREVARLVARASPYAFVRRTSSRPSSRPQRGSRTYYGTDVPGYTANSVCKTVGVVDTVIPSTGVGHRFFVCNHNGNAYLFNTNDSSQGDVPEDGSHVAKYHQYQRPMMQRSNQISLSFEAVKGECNEFSVNLSEFWHHPRHREMAPADKDKVFTHMVSCCVGASNTREWHQLLWDF